MMIKLIGNEQVEYLATKNAIQVLEKDENFEANRDLFIPDSWYNSFTNGIRDILIKYNNENNNGSNPSIDYELFDLFEKLSLEPSRSASTEFWGSLTIQTDIALELIKLRWGHEDRWFRSEIAGVDKIVNKYRRYAGNQPFWQTFMRIWWIAKMVPTDLKDVVFKQQDFADKSIMNKYVLWNETHQGKYLSRTMEYLLERVSKFDEEKKGNDHLKSVPRQTVTRKVFEWMTMLKEVTIIELMGNDDLRETIDDMFNKAIQVILEENQ